MLPQHNCSTILHSHDPCLLQILCAQNNYNSNERCFRIVCYQHVICLLIYNSSIIICVWQLLLYFRLTVMNCTKTRWVKIIIYYISNYSLLWCSIMDSYHHAITHWGRVTHICVSKLTIIGSDNGLLPGLCQAIIWTNDGILLIRPLGTNFSEILSKIHTFSFKKMHLKTSSAKCRPFCLGLNVLMYLIPVCMEHIGACHALAGTVLQMPLRQYINKLSRLHWPWVMKEIYMKFDGMNFENFQSFTNCSPFLS